MSDFKAKMHQIRFLTPLGELTALPQTTPRAGSGVIRMDPLRFLAGCRTRRLNQA